MVKRISRAGRPASVAPESEFESTLSPLARARALLQPLLATPAVFFAPDERHARTCVQTSKLLYDLGKETAPRFLRIDDSVPQLLTHTPAGDGASSSSSSAAAAAGAQAAIPFSSEQIYAQLSHHATPLLKRMDQQIRVLAQHVAAAEAAAAEAAAAEDDEEEDVDEAEEEQRAMEEDEEMMDGEEDADGGRDPEDEDMDEDAESEDGEDAEQDDGEDDQEAADGENGQAGPHGAGEYRGRGGVTEDAFFSLDDMEKFADMYEGEEDEGEIDGQEDDADRMEDDQEQNEDDEEETGEDDEDDDDAMDLEALRRKAIRERYNKSLKPLARPLGEEEVDLDEDVGEVDPEKPERFEDFFDAPPPELVKSTKKKGTAARKGKSMEEHYAEDDQQEYLDEDALDEFGGAFQALSTNQREGTIGQAKVGGRKVDAETAAAGGDAEVDESSLSTYQKQQRKLQAQISQIEKKLVQPREWAQLGEVTGKARPMDSLLETNLEFEHAGKVAPVITQEYTEELEAMIRRRILKEDWNDVLRKKESDLPGYTGKKPKPAGTELNDAKSSVGLAEVYEQEYMAEQKEAEGRPSASDEKINSQHEELSGLVSSLFHKLDALCNFHFTPRAINAREMEVQAKPNVSAIQMEEVLPTHMSSAAHTAPQEAYDVSQAVMIGSTEKSAEEKKSSHRRKKAQKKKAFDKAQEREKEKLQGMGKKALEGNAAEGVLRKAISSKEMLAATTARNVIQAGGKSAGGGKPASKSAVTGASSLSAKKNLAIGHGQNTKFANSSAFFGKLQKTVAGKEGGPKAKKQKTG
jgi:U3 small nucleolar RNA-associated protein MPP10